MTPSRIPLQDRTSNLETPDFHEDGMPLTYSVNLGIFDKLKNDLSLQTRRKIFEIFMRECAPTPDSRVADFGVSGHRSHPAHYFFEQMFPYRGNLTAIGRPSEEAEWLPNKFPGLHFLQADLRKIPLPNLHFDCGICNAVVEHAGPREQQIALVSEVSRVCRCAMFTTPNKWFPIELHTFLPVLHWLPNLTYRKILMRIGFKYFADVENLNLLDTDGFRNLFPPSRHNQILHVGLPRVPTNLICISRWRED